MKSKHFSPGTGLVCEMQNQVYRLKDQLASDDDNVARLQKLVDDARDTRNYTYQKLCETVDFLQEFNRDICGSDETWYEHSGVIPPTEEQRKAWQEDA